MALNKQAGYVNIGSETGYTKSTTQNATGTTTSVEFLDSGTILKFRPYICDSGYIRMEINPELSTASVRDVNGTSIPSKTLTTVKSNIMVKDGKTIVIGGLFKEDITNTDRQVPIIGDLPIVGMLFRSTSDQNVRKEIVILITPHIINEPEDTMADERAEDIDRIVYGSRKRVSSATRTRIYEDGYAKAVKLYSKGEYDKALDELDWIIGFRPNTLEAVQLKERILKETNAGPTERDLLNTIDAKNSEKWRRR
jgi:type II secretory pathway component GspD/PulD (secretin)